MSADLFVNEFPYGRVGLIELSDGRLLTMTPDWSAATSADGGRTWSESPLADAAQRDPWLWNPSLVRLESGVLVLQVLRQNDKGHMSMACCRSADEGRSWSDEHAINLPGATASPYHDAMIATESGRLVLPVRACFAGRESGQAGEKAMGTVRGEASIVEGHAQYPEIDIASAYFSDDQGQTWESTRYEIICWPDNGARGAYAVDEPCVAETAPGTLLMAARSTIGRIVTSTSDDNGASWSRGLPTDLCNSYSPARLVRIPGTFEVLLVWNQVSPEEIRRGFRRSRLTSAVSTDGGATWGSFKLLDCADPLDPVAHVEPGEPPSFVVARRECGELPANYCIFRYPNVDFADGNAYITYDRETFIYTGSPRRVRALRVTPIETLREDGPWDLRLSNDIPLGIESADRESNED
ncbi:MAG: hypothetical protein CMJ18_18585 [Phycisphaeraceae bacterium]|nr:hypothetical protein [Phycisphaeraceae bacterium]